MGIIFWTSDNKRLVVGPDLVKKFKAITTMLDDLEIADNSKEEIPLSTIDHKTFVNVLKWSEKYNVEKPESKLVQGANGRWEPDKEFIPEWDQEFFKQMDLSTLLEVIMAANYLNYQALFEMSCKVVANMIRGKSVDEIRKTFEIINDLTESELKKIQEQNKWCDKY